LAIILVMPRPRKDGRLRMDIVLRIPVTSDQKALIAQATSDEPEGMAAWARAVLMDAARRKLATTSSGSAMRDSPSLQSH
jgi:hypothetical protein